jgi:hypothetical protein
MNTATPGNRPFFAPRTFFTLPRAPWHRAPSYVQHEPKMTVVHCFFEKKIAPLAPKFVHLWNLGGSGKCFRCTA